MNYNINDKVGVTYNSQMTSGQIIKRYKFLWFWNRYWVLVNVNWYDEGKLLYTRAEIVKRFEGSLLTITNP